MKSKPETQSESAHKQREPLFERTVIQRTLRSVRAHFGAYLVSARGGNLKEVRTRQRAAEKLISETVAYEREAASTEMRMLFVGDSSARGVGAEHPEVSVAGHFGKDFPSAHIDNIGQDGVVIADLKKHFDPSKMDRYDIGVVHVGANNTVRFRMPSQAKLTAQLTDALTKIRTVAKNVIVLSGGDSGNCPVFEGGFAKTLHKRSEIIHAVLASAAEKVGALYVDMFENHSPLPRDDAFYAEDGFHPNGLGYSKWYEAIFKEADRADLLKLA